MKLKQFSTRILAFLSLALLSMTANAQSAGTWVDVGPGHAGAGGSATGQFQHVDTDSRVGPMGSVARGVAVGAGPNGLSISHSIGVNMGGRGTAQNFNLSIGPNGTHVSRGNVNSTGGNSRVIAGGSSNVGSPWNNPSGGSYATGYGRNTVAQTHAQTRGHHAHMHPSMGTPFGGPFSGAMGGPMTGSPMRGPMGGPFGPFGPRM